ncbi:MAG: FAD binding domain-containing protein [Proteobacteria bacterium]|nr:FAD binding domain-containing protein [Pseudomonadota bacterium]
MKPVAFDIAAPASLAEAAALLAQPGAMAMAGGQSLGPMLNLRLARPELIVRLNAIPGLAGVAEDADAVTIGALVTHAAIADGRAPDPGMGVLARAAEGIAYRAVRNRGTIGGSLCHADPAADWPTVLTALGASVLTSSGRRIAMTDFIAGAFRTVLARGELVASVRIPRLPADAGWGYAKACRKPGEFAHAMAAALTDGARTRLVIGATGGKPVLLHDADATEQGARDAALAAGLDPVAAHIQSVMARRALQQASEGARA